ncbi:hypothetical protein ACEVHA_027350 [Klebsiella pneumoniae]
MMRKFIRMLCYHGMQTKMYETKRKTIVYEKIGHTAYFLASKIDLSPDKGLDITEIHRNSYFLAIQTAPLFSTFCDYSPKLKAFPRDTMLLTIGTRASGQYRHTNECSV